MLWKIRKVFDQWRNTPALDSPLEKNQDLKTVVLEETPWVRQAVSRPLPCSLANGSERT